MKILEDRILVKDFGGDTFQELVAGWGLKPHQFFRGGKPEKQVLPGVSRQEFLESFDLELRIVFIYVRSLAARQAISAENKSRVQLAKKRLIKALGVSI